MPGASGGMRAIMRLVTERRASKAVVLTAAPLIHGIVAVQFALGLPQGYIPSSWIWQFSLLLCMSLSVAVFASLSRSPRVRKFLLALQLLVLILIGIPEGGSFTIKTNLSALLLLESVLLNPPPQDLVLTTGGLITLVAIQRIPVAWVVPVERPTLREVLAFATALLLVVSLSLILKRVLERLSEQIELTARLRDSVTRLTDANVGFQRYASAVKSESAANERKRVSREIHDTVGYTVTTLIMLMEAASDLAESDPPQLKRLLKRGIDQAICSLDEIRKSLRELRAMEDPQAHGLRGIKELVRAFEEATRVAVALDFSNVVWGFDAEIDEALYRLIQESLANAFRHGKATRIGINFWQSDHSLSVTVRDNGVGSAEINEGIGLAGMRERIQRVHGTFTAGNVADGFMLSACVPILERNGASDE